MSDHPERVYCPRCGCPTRAYRRNTAPGPGYDGNLRCVHCGEPFPGAEIEAAKGGALTPEEWRRAAWVKYEVALGIWTDWPEEVTA